MVHYADLKAVDARAGVLISTHLMQCLQELKDWQEKGRLDFGRVREVSALYTGVVSEGEALRIAQARVHDEAASRLLKVRQELLAARESPGCSGVTATPLGERQLRLRLEDLFGLERLPGDNL